MCLYSIIMRIWCLTLVLPCSITEYHDVIKRKHFPRYWPFCGEFTGHRWITLTKASDAELWCPLWSAPWINGWVKNREAGDLRRHFAHYDVIVMKCHGGDTRDNNYNNSINLNIEPESGRRIHHELKFWCFTNIQSNRIRNAQASRLTLSSSNAFCGWLRSCGVSTIFMYGTWLGWMFWDDLQPVNALC